MDVARTPRSPTPRRRELIPLAVRFAVRDALGGWGGYTVAEIEELFLAEGFSADESFEPAVTGQRRAMAERCQAAIDYGDPEQVGRYLRVVERIIADYDTSDGQGRRETLLKALQRVDIRLDERGQLRLPAPTLATSSSLAGLSAESGIRLQVARLERLDAAPEELVGAAKELVEATAKYALAELGEPVDENEDLPTLAKRVLVRLKLHPETIAPTTKGAEVMVRLLGGIAQVAGGLAELRNQGYGTGHGRSARIAGLRPRHAHLAARAAIAWSSFVIETLADPDAPWRKP